MDILSPTSSISRRRYTYGSPGGTVSDYSLTGDYEERGIEACLAAKPLGSVDLGDSSFVTSPQRPGETTAASFWNDKWKSVDDDNFPGFPPVDMTDQGSHQPDDEGVQEVAYYPPRKWGERDINLTCYWSSRVTKAMITFVITLTGLLFICRLVSILCLIDGHSWYWTISYCFPILISSILHCSIYLMDYIKRAYEPDTRFNAFIALFTLPSLREFLKFTLGGFLVSWAFAAQFGSYYQSPFLYTEEILYPNKLTKCLNEEFLYVVLGGVFYGLVLFLQRHFNMSRRRIKFPIIHRLKLLEFKSKVRPTFRKAFKKAFRPALMFTFVYHFFFSDIKHFIVTLCFFLDATTFEIEQSWYELFNIRRFLVLYLSGVLTIFSFKMASVLIRMFMLEPKTFNLELFHEQQRELSLSEAIADTRVPLIKALAFRYLLRVSQCNDSEGKDTRRKIYSLNAAGDIPAEWRAIKCECLSVIDKYTSQLDEFRGIVGSQKTKWSEDLVPNLPSQLAIKATVLKYRREHLTARMKSMNIVQRLLFEGKQLISRVPWLVYIFDDRKQNGFLRRTKDCQEMLYAVRALSCLIARSVTEDKYGVVQRDVPHILKTMSTLKDKLQNLRRVHPLCGGYSVFVQRSLVRIWLSFPDSFGSEGLKQFR